MTKIVTMKMVNIAEAKAKFSEISRRVQNGERIVLCKNNKPFAQITPLKLTPEGKRPVGLAKGLFTVPADFNEPDPQLEDDWEGVSHPDEPLTKTSK
jgi:prevent-host-death family protein